MTSSLIYHLVPSSEYQQQIQKNLYRPTRFEQDGFIHCTGDLETLIKVANDYFATISETLLILVIDTSLLASDLKFEPPAPIAGGGTEHLMEEGLLFPHVYGPLNLEAVVEIKPLLKNEKGWRL